MPRDGSNIYHRPPGTDAVPDTTIESTKYNSNVADVEQDLNTPRPIVAGGTGATTAAGALANLGAESAGQVVTNYDTFPFVSGSFASAGGATSEPVPGAGAHGIAIVNSSAYITLIAFADNDLTGKRYVRIKNVTWQPWIAETGGDKVSKAGDTMSGQLNQIAVSPAISMYASGTSGGGVLYGGTHSNLNRWGLFLGDGSPETGGDAGSNYGIYAYTDAGVQKASYLSINRVNGGIACSGTGGFSTYGPVVAGANGATGTYFFGNSSTKYLSYDGVSFTLAGGAQFAVTGDMYIGSITSQATLRFGSSGSKYLTYDGTNFIFNGGAVNTNANLYVGAGGTAASTSYSLIINGGAGTGTSGALIQWQKNGTSKWFEGSRSAIFGNTPADNQLWYSNAAAKVALELDAATGAPIINPAGAGVAAAVCALKVSCTGGGTQYGIGMQVAADNTNMLIFYNSGGAAVGTIQETAASTIYATASSGELKEDLKSFDAGNIIDATNVYDFKWKSSSERAYGVIAQQAVEVYPLAVTHSKQDDMDEDFWGVDYSKYVPVLLQELKALRARVAALEGK
jgi:hypothetical protein